ncbi:sigma-70 family RNA polymerase sigma factor [uncultured Winogradskyella sp.]|uniref:RNA polymerase sigma factor n=1 Tax=uncultured Winogradskyella sp. TaxID=395353 RepID=UPI002630ABF8|nr:sigma-70 family RNA polymerase sigma factor [uncultured Winogradskyella sp.]
MTDNSFFLEALINNDSKVIINIYKSNFFKVRAFVIKNKGQQQDAEDIFQKALMQLAVRYKKEKFVINTSFEAYLFTVCKNLWRRELNKNKVRVTNNDYLEPKDDNEDIALAVLEQKRWELFTESLELISENCKQILKLFFAKTPYAEIMKKFNYNSETVVRQRVFKCKNSLKEYVKKDKRFKNLTEL